jgi:cation transport regulator ChaC
MGYSGEVSDGSLWIFGYGSLVWRPAFAHRRSRPAAIHGFVRRFWQGSIDHRGVPGRPGRVVTLLPEGHDHVETERGRPVEACWGTAYEVPVADPDGVLAHLDHRERGGYERVELDVTIFEARPAGAADAALQRTVKGLVYIASPTNPNYLGPASIAEIGGQVASAAGPSGPNPEYVFELARSLRAMGARDDHVFAVEAEVAQRLARRSA